MVFATFSTQSLSESERQRLCLALLGLNVLQIFAAISGFFLGAYISLNVNSKAHLVRGYSLKSIGGTLSGCSIALFLLHCLGAKASNDCLYLRTRHRFENKLFLIVVGYAAMSVAILSVSVLCMMHYFQLKSTLDHGLLGAMKFYSKDRNLKRDFDEIQMDYRCCGSFNYTDWFEVKWIPEESMPSEEDKIFKRTEFSRSRIAQREHLSVPFSCCDPSRVEPCFHHRLLNSRRGEYKYTNYGFFKRGCTEALLEKLQKITRETALLMIVPFFLEMTIAVQTRYLQTSLHDCRRQRNRQSVGKCWLFRSPHEANLGLQSDAHLTMQDLLASSSSDDSDQVSMDAQTKLKDKARRKKEAISSSGGGSDDEDLRQLLLKQMNRSNKHSRSQSEVQPNKQKGKREKFAKCKGNENGKDIEGKGLETIGNIPDQKKRFGGYSARS